MISLRTLTVVIGLAFASPSSDEGFTCPPCGCERDGEHFAEAGTCPACGMRLAKKKEALNVAILVFDGVQIIDFAGPYEVFGQNPFNVFTVSKDGQPLRTAMNLTIDPRHSFADAPVPDVLVVPGGGVHAAQRDAELLEWVRGAADESDHVLSVCNGAFILARAGLLDGKTATTFYGQLDELEEVATKTTVVRDQRFVDNGKVITSAGLTSGMDAALHLVGKIRGATAAKAVALHLEYQWDPSSTYARAALADMNYPSLNLPTDNEAELLSTEGNREQWRRSYQVRTTRTLLELHSAVESQIKEATPWKSIRSETHAKRALSRWTFRGPEDGEWHAELDLVTEGDGLYRSDFRLRLHRRTGDFTR